MKRGPVVLAAAAVTGCAAAPITPTPVAHVDLLPRAEHPHGVELAAAHPVSKPRRVVKVRVATAPHRARTIRVAVTRVTPTPNVPASGPTAAQWHALRVCESGDRVTAYNPADGAAGLYQFEFATWQGVGRRLHSAWANVDPRHAPRAVQDAFARALYADRGPQPWPVCGRYL